MASKPYNSLDLHHFRIPSLWEICIDFLIVYIFFFQYGVQSINYASLLLTGACIVIGLLHFLTQSNCRIKTPYNGILAFVAVSFFLSLLFGVSRAASLDIGIRMIEYSLASYSVFLYTAVKKQRLNTTLFITWLSIFALSIYVLIQGNVVAYLGALGIGSLNTNEMSSFFILMVFCSFYLYGQTNNKVFKLVLFASLLFVFFVQIQSASRRGFAIMTAMIVGCIVTGIIPLRYSNKPKSRLVMYSIIVIIGAIAFVELRDYILSSTVLGERLLGNMTGGDAARLRYHEFAFEQFKNNPVLGVGVGGINFLLGVYSHSMFYETLSCTGIIGTLIILFALVKFFSLLLKGSFLNKKGVVSIDNKYLKRVLMVFFVALIISGVAVVQIYDFAFYYSLALIAAGLFVSDNEDVSPQRQLGGDQIV